MPDEEIAFLKNEIVRLNKIINILIEQNEQLRSGIAYPKTQDIYPFTGIGFAENKEGKDYLWDDKNTFRDGNTNTENTLKEIREGIPQNAEGLERIKEGNNKSVYAVNKTWEGNPTSGPVLPPVIHPSPEMIRALSKSMKLLHYNRVRKSARKNAALLLIHFHNRSGGDYPGLRKLTGLSNFGLAKFIRSMKEKGLIVRRGWQKFGLTQSSENMVRDAWLQTDGRTPAA